MNRAGIVKLVLIWTALPRVRDCRFSEAALLPPESPRDQKRPRLTPTRKRLGVASPWTVRRPAGWPSESGSPARAGPQSMS